jgi:hypothetical protein
VPYSAGDDFALKISKEPNYFASSAISRDPECVWMHIIMQDAADRTMGAGYHHKKQLDTIPEIDEMDFKVHQLCT